MDVGELVDSAKGTMFETVLKKSKDGFVPPGVIEWSPGPAPVEYLDIGEQPHFVAIGMNKALIVRGDSDTDLRERSRVPINKMEKGRAGESQHLSASAPFCNIMLLTDQRILLFIGRADGDIVVEFDYEEHDTSHRSEEPTFGEESHIISADGLYYHLQFWPTDTSRAVHHVNRQFDRQNQEFEQGTEPRSYHEKVTRRIKKVMKIERTDIKEVFSTDENSYDRWLDIHARWESLRTIGEPPRTPVPVANLKGIGQTLAENLRDNGYTTAYEIRRASVAELIEIDGIGEGTAWTIHKHACCRRLDQIRYVGPTIENSLRKNGYRHGGDISAVSSSELTKVDGVGDNRAEKIRGRARSWLPDHDHMTPFLFDQYSPPFDDIDDAERQIDELEKILLDPNGERLSTLLDQFESLESAERGIRETVLEVCIDYRDEDEDQAILNERWITVAERLLEVLENRQTQSLPAEVSTEFDQLDIPVTSLSPAEVMNSTLPQAEELVTTAEEEITIRTQFINIATEAADLVETLNRSDIKGGGRIQDAISIQMMHARSHLTGNADGNALKTIKEFIRVCDTSVKVAHTHRDHPFEETIIALASAGESGEMDTRNIRDINEIVTIADDALRQLSSLEYDHPAIDRESWIEGIELALEEQYLPALTPVSKQLERISEGLWSQDDLHLYSWQEFETLVGDLYRDEGFGVEITQGSTDFGVDVWAHNETEHVAIQVKQFQRGGTVGRETLQKLVSTLAKGDADRAVVITSGEFANTATRYAQDFGDQLDLVGSDELIRRLSESSIPPRDQ